MLRCELISLLGLVFAASFGRPLLAAGSAQYFLLVVWDGMRPDFVSPELTPTLQAVREGGVWFANHRNVYPTFTEANGAVLATGVLFACARLPCTFPLAEVKLDSLTAPDVVVASRWKLIGPVRGHLRVEMVNDGYQEFQAGGGMHATLSPTDRHNLAVAAGPGFKRAFIHP